MKTVNHSKNLNTKIDHPGLAKSNDEITYRIATKDDINNIAGLMNSVWAPAKTYEYFLWLVFESPLSAVITCAYQKNKLAGMFILHRRKLSNGAYSGWASGLLVDKDYRGKGIFTVLGNMATECFPELAALFSITNLSGKYGLERSLDFRTIGKIATLALPVSDDFNNSFATEVVPITSETEFENLLDCPPGTIMFDHSGSYRHWRYAQHKMRSFSKVSIESGKYLVTTIYKDPNAPITYGDIVDIECPVYDEKILDELILGSAWHMKAHGAQRITIWTNPHSEVYKSASRLGFTQDHQDRFFCAKVLNTKYDYLYDFSKWQLMQSDAIR